MLSFWRKDVIGHSKRVASACIGIALVGLGIFRQNMNGHPIPMWRRVLVVAGGFFFLYIASMYYLPKNRRRRAELDALLGEAEGAERRRTDSH
jgi:hypothetical protein